MAKRGPEPGMKWYRPGAQGSFKLLDDGSGNGSFEGYGSTFGNADRAGDVVMPGAFAGTLEQFRENGFIAVGHDWAGLPVATVAEAYEDDKGLYIRGEFHGTDEAQEARQVVRERLERGKSVGLSIGYRVNGYAWSADDEDVLQLTEIELFEVSIVTVPCNPMAGVTGAKSAAVEQREVLGAEAAAAAAVLRLKQWARRTAVRQAAIRGE